MADVTISDLNAGTPAGTGVVPYSDGTTTYKSTITNLPVAWNSVTGKPSIGTNASGAKTISTGAPAGGSSGDIWYQV
jgi:hypothetical protein